MGRYHFPTAAELYHYGVKGMKWGVRNGPPYPLDKSKKSGKMKSTIVQNAIRSGEVSKKVNREKQLRHMLKEHIPGRSYINGDFEYAQKLIDDLSGTGEPIINKKTGEWQRKEKVADTHVIGTYVDSNTGKEFKTNEAMIVYSKTGSHIYPRRGKPNA